MGEHLVQMAQVYWWAMPRSQSHGVLGEIFDLEWVHLAYNSLFLAGLVVPFVLRGRVLRERARGPVWSLFVAGATIQAYHEIEHFVKIGQHLNGATPAPGILGSLVDLVFLHLMFNLVVYVLVLPFLLLMMRRRIPGKVRRPDLA